MRRHLLTLLVPPLAVCRFGCPGCCAAPIAVFWLAGITALVYAFFGGPAGAPGLSLGTLALGAALWLIAAAWALLTVRTTEEGCEERPPAALCRALGAHPPPHHHRR